MDRSRGLECAIGTRRSHPLDRPAQVDGRRSSRRELIGGGVEAIGLRKHEAVGGGDADRRSTAHSQARDRIRNLRRRSAAQPCLPAGQAGLVEDVQDSVREAERRDHAA